MEKKAIDIFEQFDIDHSKTIDKSEALAFWKNKFAKLQAEALFNSVDINKDGHIQLDEWVHFWEIVKGAGYSEPEISEELDNLKSKGEWRQWDKLPLNHTNSKHKGD